MFALIATVCLSADASTCRPIAWTKEMFPTEQACVEAGSVLVPELGKQFFYVNGNCVAIIQTPNV